MYTSFSHRCINECTNGTYANMLDNLFRRLNTQYLLNKEVKVVIFNAKISLRYTT